MAKEKKPAVVVTKKAAKGFGVAGSGQWGWGKVGGQQGWEESSSGGRERGRDGQQGMGGKRRSGGKRRRGKKNPQSS